MKYLLYTIFFSLFISCSSDDGGEVADDVVCTTSVEPSFRITVRDAVDNSLLEGVTVTALENSFSAILALESPGVYIGPNERTGTYILSIEKVGYQTVTITEPQIVTLTENRCHVATIESTYQLEVN
ncbi:hypothetical protein [Dokdonia sp. Hel_I_53]|uniref:hypothetical protein n=1 Tax=Dokdonia sp. Hel_I_53 TaxID=1566287 RepID=UPI0011992782|nr:hypothetical protein [Dokdonia sp. Hel_I_53]TVZ51552.1 hypothetical protein OD90_0697 [Dokdonia sp. Hel_I_53]